MLKYILKLFIWRLTPVKKRGAIPLRPPFDFIKSFTMAIVFFAILAAVMTYTNHIKVYTGELNFNDFWKYVEEDKVTRVELGSSQLFMVHFTDGTKQSMLSPNYPDFRREMMEAGLEVRFVSGTMTEALLITLTSTMFTVVLLVICCVLLRTVMQTSSMKAEKAKERTVTFDDVRGMSETKEELRFAVEQLRHLGALSDIGARPVKGILLEGPPGVGKTLLAKAIAGEAGVPLISASGSDFIEMFVGVGAARVRKLWQQAIDSSPCVLFIDEIDAVGRQRGANMQNMESNQTINALLQRMDGLGKRADILVIGATNRKEDLDQALLRPGRFDRVIYVGPPRSQADREDICDLYLSKIKIAKDVTVAKVAKLTAGMTGADIAQCLNDAVLLVAREARNLAEQGDSKASDAALNQPVTLAHIDQAVTRHLLGGVATGHISEAGRKLAAYHEAGHAVVRLSQGIDILKVSVTPYTTGAGGLTQTDTDDEPFLSKDMLLDRIRFILGGMAAEQMIFGQHSTGVSSDVNKASVAALEYVNTFGMSGILNEGALRDLVGFRGITDEKLKQAESVLQSELAKTSEICEKYKHKVIELAERLLAETTILNLTPDFLQDEI